MKSYKFSIFSITLLLLVSFSSLAQDKKQLQEKREKLQKEIKQINLLLSKTKKDEKNVLSRLGDINKKIEVRQHLINTINKESSALSNEINVNKKKISSLNKQLKSLKREHANMVVQTYKTKNKQNSLLFLLSSESFTQAYKRMQYMRQFTDHRKKQAKKIAIKKELLVVLNDSLKVKKKTKDLLIAAKIKERKNVDSERVVQQELLNKVKKKEKKYISQIKKKQKAERNFEKQLTDLISGIIVKSNKKTGRKSKTLSLTPEAKKLASSFIASKGNLPHPVIKGYVSRYFGERPHEILKKIKVKSIGWHFITEENAKARSVFKGTVFAIMVDRKTKLKTILLQHGNYITTYKNLTTLLVKKGDKVTAKQNLGIIHTDQTTGKTKLAFSLMKNAVPQNPSGWLTK
ncbi:MAG: peptidoglycan DD-metalloendopeptidase family protein [Flavobacteriaceae bacterium]|nr:peptidoglycan DD-metalloendopeptidase family protein [Flavobacteriaceae bacterium]